MHIQFTLIHLPHIYFSHVSPIALGSKYPFKFQNGISKKGLYKRVSVTPPSPPFDFPPSVLSLYPRFESYCEYRITSNIILFIVFSWCSKSTLLRKLNGSRVVCWSRAYDVRGQRTVLLQSIDPVWMAEYEMVIWRAKCGLLAWLGFIDCSLDRSYWLQPHTPV